MQNFNHSKYNKIEKKYHMKVCMEFSGSGFDPVVSSCENGNTFSRSTNAGAISSPDELLIASEKSLLLCLRSILQCFHCSCIEEHIVHSLSMFKY